MLLSECGKRLLNAKLLNALVSAGVGLMVLLTLPGLTDARAPSRPEEGTNGEEAKTHGLAPKSLRKLLALSPKRLAKVDISCMNLLCAQGLPGAEKLDAAGIDSCLATGHAAGLAAALCAKQNLQPRELSVKLVQEALRADGVDLHRAGDEQEGLK